MASMTWEQFGILASFVIWGGMALIVFLSFLKRQFAILWRHARKTPVQTLLAVVAVGICTAYAQKPKPSNCYTVTFEVPTPYAPIDSMSCETGKVYCLPGMEDGRTWIRGWHSSEKDKRYDPSMMFFDLAKPGETIQMKAVFE